MKYLYQLMLAAVLASGAASCSVKEEINLSVAGAGYYETTTDLGPMMEMVTSMGGGKEMPDSILNKVMDSTMSMAGMLDSVGDGLTDAEKRFYAQGVIRIHVDMKNKETTIQMRSPIASLADFARFLKVSVMVDSLKKANKKPEAEDGGMPNLLGDNSATGLLSNLPSMSSPFVVTDSSIERRILPKEQLQQQMGEMQGAEMFLNQMNYSITIKLPRTIKRVEGSNIKLLPDGKSAFFAASISDMASDPAQQYFKIVF